MDVCISMATMHKKLQLPTCLDSILSTEGTWIESKLSQICVRSSWKIDTIMIAESKNGFYNATSGRIISKSKMKMKRRNLKTTKHPRYLDMITQALKVLEEKKGLSRQALLKYIKEHYYIDYTSTYLLRSMGSIKSHDLHNTKIINRYLKQALRAGIRKGILRHTTGRGAAGSFKLVAPKVARNRVRPARVAPRPKRQLIHPPFSEMIIKALVTLKETGGSSCQAILKYIQKNFEFTYGERVINRYLKKTLRSGVRSGMFKQSRGIGAVGRFKLGSVKRSSARRRSRKLRHGQRRAEIEAMRIKLCFILKYNIYQSLLVQ